MQLILEGRARRRKGPCSGGDHVQVMFDEVLVGTGKTVSGENLVALNEAIEKLEKQNPSKAEQVRPRKVLRRRQGAGVLGIA